MLKKLLFLILGFVVILFINAPTAKAEERIKSFIANVQVNTDGSIDVTETISYDFGYVGRHGIYRDVPTIVYRENNTKYVLKYKVTDVTDEVGESYQYSMLYPSDHLRLKIGDPNNTITGVHTYEIKYKVAGALTYFKDHTELYWNGTGNQWEVPIDAALINVQLPKTVPGNSLKLACYTGALGSSKSDCTMQSKGEIISFISRPLLEKEGVSVVVGFPNGIVATLQAEKFIPFSERWYGRLIIGFAILLALLWYVVYPAWIVIKWLRQGRDPRPLTGETTAWYDPPTASKGRKLTPVETGSLIDEKVDNRDISALFVDLARRGYMSIDEREKKDFYLTRENKAIKSDSLMPFEKDLLDKVFESETTVRVKDSLLYSVIESTKRQIYSQMVSDGFFAKDPSKIRIFYGVIAFLGFITFNIQLALTAIFFGLHMANKTQEGSSAAAMSRSLRNFLSTQERQLTFQASKQMMFERLLPFAVAFGVEKIWAERFKDIDLKQPDWYSSSRMGAFNSAVFVSSLDSSLKSVSVASQPPHSSSGSGFSGGFSGGGGGGGGGGSW